MLRKFAIFLPLLLYIFMFFWHRELQSYLGLESKCEHNFIVDLDYLIFGKKTYYFFVYIQHWTLDLLSSMSYLMHFTLPFLYSIYLLAYKKHCSGFLRFILAFGTVNFLGVLIQKVVPTPPPWMLAELKGPPEANFARVDSILNTTLFKCIYSNSPLICGSFPSLHTAWPTIILFSNAKPWFSRNFSRFHVALIAFSAVYSGHHFIIDVIFGFLFACFCTKLSIYWYEEMCFDSETKQQLFIIYKDELSNFICMC